MKPDALPLPLAAPAEPHSLALASAEQRADAIAGTIHLARALAREHWPIDLTGLDRDVGALCASALDLPPAEGRALRPRLVGLLQALDELAESLREPLPSG